MNQTPDRLSRKKDLYIDANVTLINSKNYQSSRTYFSHLKEWLTVSKNL